MLGNIGDRGKEHAKSPQVALEGFRLGRPNNGHPLAPSWGHGCRPRGSPAAVRSGQLSGVACWTNSFVKVLVMSIDLPCTVGLKAERTARQVAGPSAGMSPVGL